MSNPSHPNSMLVIRLYAPPGAGKSTAAKKLGLDIISTGEMLRDHRDRGTDLGKRAQAALDAGGLVDDGIVNGIVEDRLKTIIAKGDSKGFVFDGFPRTAEQAKFLDDLLQKMGIVEENIRTIVLNVEDDELRTRIQTRYQGALAAGEKPRRDDDPVVFEERLRQYKAYSGPTLRYYGDHVQFVDGNGNKKQTLAGIQEAISAPTRIVRAPRSRLEGYTAA